MSLLDEVAPAAEEHQLFSHDDPIAGWYRIIKKIPSPATLVMFVQKERKENRLLCIKLWVPCDNNLYNTKDPTARIRYTKDGLSFNRRFAENVYLGIAPIIRHSSLPIHEELEGLEIIQLGQLISEPENQSLQEGVEYALVMEYLEEHWRLDKQLDPQKQGNEAGIAFLAKEVANMHKRLEPSNAHIGDAATNAKKWQLNKTKFSLCLEQLFGSSEDSSRYQEIGDIMDDAQTYFKQAFDKRYENGHIKRCHGDLKATNLWIRPEQPSISSQKQLLALDCVDFEPEFCHIDTLSDVAMLAIDVEMHVKGTIGEANHLVHEFLRLYLLDVEEQEDQRTVLSLLEYYMTEKAIICAYMSILYDEHFDKHLDWGGCYLEIAQHHAHRLQERMPQQSLYCQEERPPSFTLSQLNPLRMLQGIQTAVDI